MHLPVQSQQPTEHQPLVQMWLQDPLRPWYRLNHQYQHHLLLFQGMTPYLIPRCLYNFPPPLHSSCHPFLRYSLRRKLPANNAPASPGKDNLGALPPSLMPHYSGLIGNCAPLIVISPSGSHLIKGHTRSNNLLPWRILKRNKSRVRNKKHHLPTNLSPH